MWKQGWRRPEKSSAQSGSVRQVRPWQVAKRMAEEGARTLPRAFQTSTDCCRDLEEREAENPVLPASVESGEPDKGGSQTPNQFRFQVALSFPGEYRTRVEEIARSLADELGQANVLYDQWYRAEFARPNLDVHLPGLYHEQSLLVVFFLCSQYVEKDWCGLEWCAGRNLLKRGQDERIMLLRLDDADIPGLYSIGCGYFGTTTNWRKI